MPTLAHERVEPHRSGVSGWLYYLHGIFGTGRNWAPLARDLARRRPDWGGVLVDLRLHGESSGFEPPHTVAACAADLGRLAEGLSDAAPLAALLGHSFGGKIALAAIAERSVRPRSVWIVDATPDARAPGGSAVEMLEALRALPGPFDERARAIRRLERRGFDARVAVWMATNLIRVDDGLRWRFELDAMEALLDDFFRADLWTVVEAPPPGVRLHFVKARGSDVLDTEACRRIEAAARLHDRVRLHRVDGGHWVNIDDPEGLLDLLAKHLPSGA